MGFELELPLLRKIAAGRGRMLQGEAVAGGGSSGCSADSVDTDACTGGQRFVVETLGREPAASALTRSDEVHSRQVEAPGVARQEMCARACLRLDA